MPEGTQMTYIRKTIDEWEVQGNCGYGWECETTESSRKDALAQVKCYRENVTYPMRIVKKCIARPTATRLQVFKSGRRWCAHLYWSDGACWPWWQHGFKTKGAVIAAARCTYSGPIERGCDEGGIK
jgi:hypothetical protein